jgi:hypothetical protein
MLCARKDLHFPFYRLAECKRAGIGRCTFPEITPGISFGDFADERGFFSDRALGSGSVWFGVPSSEWKVRAA